jgi:predicted RNA-binding Zn ribbon-like protein
MDVMNFDRYSQAVIERAALEFVNSLTPDGEDLLHDRRWRAQALRRWNLPRHLPSPAELRELDDLRVFLRELAGTVSAGAELSRSQLAALNDVIGCAPVRAQVVPLDGGYVVEMTPVADTWIQLAVRQLAGSFVSALRQSHPPRVRLCANDACRRAFYDESKNRTRRWCDPRNRARVRRHRARARAT